jgi:hypothetical protein
MRPCGDVGQVENELRCGLDKHGEVARRGWSEQMLVWPAARFYIYTVFALVGGRKARRARLAASGFWALALEAVDNNPRMHDRQSHPSFGPYSAFRYRTRKDVANFFPSPLAETAATTAIH